MDCCSLSSIGLKAIDAYNITSDNITSFLDVSGFSNPSMMTDCVR